MQILGTILGEDRGEARNATLEAKKTVPQGGCGRLLFQGHGITESVNSNLMTAEHHIGKTSPQEFWHYHYQR